MATPEPASAPLAEFVELIERLHREHTVSFIAAGDEKVYAYGGNGYDVIVSQDLFRGLVELETPTGTLRIEPDESGALAVRADDGEDQRPVDERLAEATRSIELYYRRRYWKT
jgi:hypothetical protein